MPVEMVPGWESRKQKSLYFEKASDPARLRQFDRRPFGASGLIHAPPAGDGSGHYAD